MSLTNQHELDRELLLTARARRRLLDQTLLERRTLLVLSVLLALLAVMCALVDAPGPTAVAALASGMSSTLLRHLANRTDDASKP